jgi:predicted acetyltransferase
MAEDYHDHGEDFDPVDWEHGHRDFAGYIEHLRLLARGKKRRAGYVLTRTFWLDAGDEFIGSSRLRPKLTLDLMRDGGNISYTVRPSYRGGGYGTRLLHLTLVEAKRAGLDKVLLTCNVDNDASIEVIKRNNGVFQDEAIVDWCDKRVFRFTIDLCWVEED